MGEGISLDRDGPVFVLSMRAGENRVEPGLLAAFAAALDEVEGAAGPAALVTTGEGRFYSNGLDLAWLAGAGRDRAGAVLGDLHRLLARVLVFPMATVAAVNGHAFAAGAMLAIAHDFRVMRRDRGYLCLPEIDLATGQPLTEGMTALLSARLPAATLQEALLTGKRYGGTDACARGLVGEACAAEELLPRAVALARELCDKDRATMAAIKRGLHRDTLAALERC